MQSALLLQRTFLEPQPYTGVAIVQRIDVHGYARECNVIVVESRLRLGVAHVVVERTLAPVERAYTIGSCEQIEAAIVCLQPANTCCDAHRIARHVYRSLCVGYVKAVERDVPVRRCACSIFRNGVAKGYIQTCALQCCMVDMHCLVIKIDASAAQREQSDASLDTRRWYETGCIEFGICQFEAVDHYIAMKQRAQTHARRKLAGVGNGVCLMAQRVVGLCGKKAVDGQV